jgi:hypothetical protein
MKMFMIDLAFSAISAIYWWIFVTIVFGAFGGDYAPNTPPPSETYQMLITALSITVGVFVFAFFVAVWRRMTMRAPR